MSPYPSRNVHVPRQRAASLAGSSEYHYARRHREHRLSRLRNVPRLSLRRYRLRPFRSDRNYLNKAIYVTYHGQDKLMRNT